MNPALRFFCFLTLFFAWQPLFAQSSFLKANQRLQKIALGKESYIRNCSGCHGITGEGNGPAANMLNPRPRNFVTGSYKFRSTPLGSMPTNRDLLKTINEGIYGTSMPSFRLIPDTEKLAIIEYLKSLKSDWKELESNPVLLSPVPEHFKGTQPVAFLASALKGKALYEGACLTCHGVSGLGDGPSAEGLLDADNRPIVPASLQAKFVKGGYEASDVFRAITTGLDGTPMPAFEESLSNEDRWNIVAYVFYLRGLGQKMYPDTVDLAQLFKSQEAIKQATDKKAAAEQTSTPDEGAWD